MDLGNGRSDLAGWKIDITHLLRQVEKRCVSRSDSDQKSKMAGIVTGAQTKTLGIEDDKGSDMEKDTSRAMLKSDEKAKKKLQMNPLHSLMY